MWATIFFFPQRRQVDSRLNLEISDYREGIIKPPVAPPQSSEGALYGAMEQDWSDAQVEASEWQSVRDESANCKRKVEGMCTWRGSNAA